MNKIELKSNDREENVELETVLSKFKAFGPYNLRCIILVILLAMTNEMYYLNYIFGAADIDYRCRYTECQDTQFSSPVLNVSISNGRCQRYDLVDTSTCSVDNINMSSVRECSEWLYEEPDSFIEEFNLECEDWKRTLVGTIHGTGYMVGLLIVGPISDKIGRKKMVVFTAVAAAVMGLIRSFITWYWFYVALEMLEAIFADTCSPTYTYVVELATKENRVLFTSSMQMMYGVGEMLLPLIAWLVPYWRNFLRYLYVPSLMMISYWFLLDESVRWLLTKGRKDEAVDILKKMARINKVHVDDDVFSRLKCEERTPSVALLPLIKITMSSRRLLLRLLGCICMWITNTFSYQTLVINSVSLEGDKYWNFALAGFSYIPSCVLMLFVLRKFKRRIPLIAAFIMMGVFCVLQPFVPKESWMAIALFFAGKFMSSVTMQVVYLYTSELFPTYTRNTMHAFCSSIGRIGSILAPQTPLLVRYWSGLPALLVGALSLAAGFITILMPDAADEPLPDTVLQAEALGLATTKKSDPIDG